MLLHRLQRGIWPAACLLCQCIHSTPSWASSSTPTLHPCSSASPGTDPGWMTTQARGQPISMFFHDQSTRTHITFVLGRSAYACATLSPASLADCCSNIGHGLEGSPKFAQKSGPRPTVSALAEGRHRCAHLVRGFYIFCACHWLSRQLPLLGWLGLRCTVGLALALAAGRLLKVVVVLACLNCSLGCWCSASCGWLLHQTVDVGSNLLLQGPAVGQSWQLSTPLLQDA